MDEGQRSAVPVPSEAGKIIKSHKYLIFTLGDEQFGIPLTQVKEINGLIEITSVPNVASYFKGVINLRGRIISVIDLKTKLGVTASRNANQKPCIIICEFGSIVLGGIVDDVCEVTGIDESLIERSVDSKLTNKHAYITGIAKHEQRGLVLLLDIAKVLDVQDYQMLQNQQHHNAA